MFDHSIKVPRLYKTASKIAKQVSEGKGSIKQLVYEGKHPNIKALYALVVHTYQRTDDIEKLLKKSKLLVKEPRFDPWLAKILITELLWGKKRLSGQAKPVKTILAYEQILKAHLSDVSDDFQDFQVDKPRYARINTLKITVNEAIEAFRNEGWILKRYTDSSNYLGFVDAVANLGEGEFMVDFHIPYLLIFPPKTQFYQHPAYKNGNIILQDKASCLPVHILSPEPGSTILDTCAAPGMKTSQCAAVIEDRGKIYAVDIGKRRSQTLSKIIKSSGATCVEVINADVITLSEEQCPNVEYILVDPSCSGSGITDRVEIGQQEMEQHKNRLEKLAAFQITILRFALTRFPKARRVVYSTCSVYPEENEDVVRQVLETCTRFRLVPAAEFVKNKWENFGSSEFGDIGNYCMYAKPDIDLTSGFFVAVFERLEEGESNPFLNTRLFSRKFKKWAKRKQGFEKITENLKEVKIEGVSDSGKECLEEKVAHVGDVKVEADTITQQQKKKKPKDRDEPERIKEELADSYQDLGQEFVDGRDASSKKKKKKKYRPESAESVADTETGMNSEKTDIKNEDEVCKNKKKKKEKYQSEQQDLGEDYQSKKKKKTKKEVRESEENLDEEAEPKNENEICVDKKRKIEKHRNELETFLDGLQDIGLSKKKKKKRDRLENAENLVDEEAIDDGKDVNEDEVQKRKKKKKGKHESESETVAEGLEVQELASEHKKKKKKIRNNEES